MARRVPQTLQLIRRAGVPLDENERLLALERYDLLDTAPEPGFDDIIALTTQLCDAPVALVSLVDRNRQWFKARIDFPTRRPALDASVCLHTIEKDDLLVITDLRADARTATNPMVTGEPYLRFYAGAPLRTPEGAVLGTLCVLDRKPRPEGLSAVQGSALRALAAQVMLQMEHRRNAMRLQTVVAEQRATIRQQDILIDTQTRITESEGDLDAILRLLVQGATEALPQATGGVIELRDGEELVYRAAHGAPTPHLELRLPLRGSLSGVCATTGVAFVVEDTSRDPRADQALVARLGLRSCILVPIVRVTEVIGVLKIQADRPGAFTGRDLQVARLFAAAATGGLAAVNEVSAQRQSLVSGARYRAIFESAIDYGIIAADLTGRVTEWNEGAARIMGWSAAEMTGRPAATFFTPEDAAADVPAREMAGALTHGRSTDERWHMRRDGTRFFAQGEMMVLRDGDNVAIGFLKVLRDRTTQHIDQERLKASQRQLATERAILEAVLHQAPVGISVAGATPEAPTLLNAAAESLIGYGGDGGAPACDAGLTALHRDGRAYTPTQNPTWRALREGETVRNEPMLYRKTGSEEFRSLDVSSAPVRGDDGAIRAAVTVFADVTETQRTLTEFKRLAAIVEQSTDFIGVSRPDGAMTKVNGAGRIMVGLDPATVVGATTLRDYVDPDLWPMFEREVFPAVLRDGHWRGELRFRRFDTGALIPVLHDMIALRDDDGHVGAFATVTSDITAQKRVEAEQDIRNRELSHRMKNSLAMVQSIAHQTLRRVPDREPVAAFEKRLLALSTAHEVLLQQHWNAASLKALLDGALALHGDAARFTVAGPDIEFGPSATLSMALLIHELATNAAKYGALSAEGGRVDLRWLVSAEGAGEPRFVFTWRETGGPTVTAPVRTGFGSRLIRLGLGGGGDVDLSFAPHGLEATFRAPLTIIHHG